MVNIIIKDLEEIRILSEEVSQCESNSSLVIDLALNKARLLCQEIELLRDLTAKTAPVELATDESFADNEEEEVEDHYYPEPELEIINPEDLGTEDEEDIREEEEEESDDEEELELPLEEEEQDEEVEEEEEEDLAQQPEEELEEKEPEFVVDNEEEEEENWNEEEEDILAEEEEVEQMEQPVSNVQSTELKNESQPGIREIHIDDMDDDDIQPIRVAPTTANARPPMREIPKPEDAITESQEKKLLGEKFHKERSINETLGEQKSFDSKLGNSPITSLKTAIGLNDRFLFIREIFNNNSAKYNEIIDRLDQMDQIQEAVEYLRANLSMQKNEASMKFVDLLKRRFTK